MSERFVSAHPLPEGHARELLTILSEECCEVAVRVSKALRFGLGDVQAGQVYTNSARLGHELGDVLEMVSRAMDAGLIFEQDILDGRANKRRQLAKFMQTSAAQSPATPEAEPCKTCGGRECVPAPGHGAWFEPCPDCQSEAKP